MRVHSTEIREAVQEPIQQIVDAVRRALEITPPELASDIVDRGIVMTGGGALIRGLDLLLAQETGLPDSRRRGPAHLRGPRHRTDSRRLREIPQRPVRLSMSSASERSLHAPGHRDVRRLSRPLAGRPVLAGRLGHEHRRHAPARRCWPRWSGCRPAPKKAGPAGSASGPSPPSVIPPPTSPRVCRRFSPRTSGFASSSR